MNKIYKVIWSKARNCYVAVSEIAKRNGKSCTSVNCGAKANRSHVALALSLALCVTSGAVFTMPQVASADGTITVTDAANPPATLSSASYGWNVTMYWPTDSSITELNITGGQKYNHVFAGYCAYGTVSGHTVTVSRADPAVEVGKLFGGVTPEPSGGANLIKDNHVIVYGGKIHGDVSGGSAISYNGGTAKNNTVYINAEVSGDDFTVKGSVFGGFSRNGNVTGNSVSLINGKVINDNDTGGDVIGGYVGQDGNAGGDGEGEGNTVSISGGTVARSVYGGYVYNGTGSAIKNEVTISGGTVTGAVFGGYIAFGGSAIEKNKVNIDTTVSATNVTVNNSIYGGYSNPWATTTGTISGNEVLIRGSKATVNSSGSGGVFGGYSSLSGTVSKNTVTISDGANINTSVYGGYSSSGTVGGTAEGERNMVTITGGTVTGIVYGGYVYNGTGSAIKNEVSITGGETKDVIGGESSSGSVIGNKVTIDTTVTGATDVSVQRVYGGKGNESAEITGNEVSIRGSKTKVNIIVESNTAGVYGVYGGHSSGSGTVSKNNVTISNEAEVKCYDVYGGYSVDGDAGGTSADEGNTVTVSDSTLTGFVIGGRSKNGNANYNSVTVNNSTLTSEGKNKFVQGGRAGDASVGDGTANFNTVTINGSTITVSGTSNYASIYGGRSTSGKADSNTVTINSTTITTSGTDTAVSIYGGASDNKTTACNNNTVNLLGASKLDGKGSTNIYGSNETAGTGNELHIGGVKGSTATSSDNIWKNGTTNKVSSVNNFATIALHDVAWSTSVPALYAGKVSNVGTLDITSMKLYDGTTEKTTFTADEVMDLLKSDTDLSALKLKYNSDPADTVTTDGVTIATRNNTNWTAATDLTFSGDQTDKVKLNDTGKAIVYSVAEANTVKSAVLSATLAWNSSDTYAYYKNEKNTFTTGTTFDLSGFKITSDSALTENPVNKTMTLISGSVLGTTSQPKAVPSMDVSVTQANVVLDGTTSSGTAAIGDGKLTYKVTGVTLNSVTVNGAENGAVPDGWVAGTGKIEVAAGTSYTAPAAATTILSGTDALQFTETNTNIAEISNIKLVRWNRKLPRSMEQPLPMPSRKASRLMVRTWSMR